MKALIFLVIMLIGLQANGAAQIRMLGVEGMGDTGAVQGELYAPLNAKYPGVIQYQHSTWQNWSKYVQTPWTVMACHSLGGDSCVQMCEWLKAHGLPQPLLLILMGARHQAGTSWLDFLWPTSPFQDFTAPNNVTYNFYTWGPLPSSPVADAQLNVNVSKDGYWHGNIPADPQVFNLIDGFIKNWVQLSKPSAGEASSIRRGHISPQPRASNSAPGNGTYSPGKNRALTGG